MSTQQNDAPLDVQPVEEVKENKDNNTHPEEAIQEPPKEGEHQANPEEEKKEPEPEEPSMFPSPLVLILPDVQKLFNCVASSLANSRFPL